MKIRIVSIVNVALFVILAFSIQGELTNANAVDPSIVANNGAKYSISQYLNLTIDDGTGIVNGLPITQMCFSENGTTWSAWVAYADIGTLEISKGNGVRTIYVKFKNSNGIESPVYQTSIELMDPAKMAGVKYTLDLGGGMTTTASGIVMNFGQRGGMKLEDAYSGGGSPLHSLTGIECKSMIPARLHRFDTVDDLIVDLGPGAGIWIFDDCVASKYRQLHPLSCKSMVAADINADGLQEIIIDFGKYTDNQYKIWIYTPWNNSWTGLHTLSCRSMTPSYVTWYLGQNQSSAWDLVVDFGPQYGIWVWIKNDHWEFLHPLSADQIVSGDIDSDYTYEVIVNFGKLYGTWIYYPRYHAPNPWTRFHSQSPKLMGVHDIDGDWAERDDVILDYGDNAGVPGLISGIWVFRNEETMSSLHPLTTYGFVFSGSSVIFNFGPQLSIQEPRAEWNYNEWKTTPNRYWHQVDTNYAE